MLARLGGEERVNAMGILYRNIGTLLTLEGAAAKQGRGVLESDLGLHHKMQIYVEGGKIAWIGTRLPKEYTRSVKREVDMQKRTVLPGFIECHTHLIFAGDRAAEFEMRNQGVSYQEIAKQGGGILSTMKNTRQASLQRLTELGQRRAQHFVSQGVTTLEAKSGYALNLKDEVKMLQASRAIKGPRVVNTFLGAHALPPEFKTYSEYLDYLAREVLPVIRKKNLAERVDIFIEKGFFPREEAQRYLEKAKSLGFDVVAHADQLTLSGGADVAIKVGALSGDHLLQVGESEVQRLAKSEVTCVLLPAADLYMKTLYPPARKMIDAGARVALATDFNPGSSPTQDLSFVGLLARLEMKMTLPEVIAAYTVGASYALNLQNRVGSLEVGKCADFIGIEQDWKTLFYSVGELSRKEVFIHGKRVFSNIK